MINSPLYFKSGMGNPGNGSPVKLWSAAYRLGKGVYKYLKGGKKVTKKAKGVTGGHKVPIYVTTGGKRRLNPKHPNFIQISNYIQKMKKAGGEALKNWEL